MFDPSLNKIPIFCTKSLKLVWTRAKSSIESKFNYRKKPNIIKAEFRSRFVIKTVSSDSCWSFSLLKILFVLFEMNSRSFRIDSSHCHSSSFQPSPSFNGHPPRKLKISFSGFTPRSLIISGQSRKSSRLTICHAITEFFDQFVNLKVEVFRWFREQRQQIFC